MCLPEEAGRFDATFGCCLWLSRPEGRRSLDRERGRVWANVDCIEVFTMTLLALAAAYSSHSLATPSSKLPNNE